MRLEAVSLVRDSHSHQTLKLMGEQKDHEASLACEAEGGAQCGRQGRIHRWEFSLAKQKSGSMESLLV